MQAKSGPALHAVAGRLKVPCPGARSRAGRSAAQRKIAPTRVQHVARDAQFEAAAASVAGSMPAHKLLPPAELVAGDPQPPASGSSQSALLGRSPHGASWQAAPGRRRPSATHAEEEVAGASLSQTASGREQAWPSVSCRDGRDSVGAAASPGRGGDAVAVASPAPSCGSVHSATGSSAWPSPHPSSNVGLSGQEAPGCAAAAAGQSAPNQARPGRGAWERRLAAEAAVAGVTRQAFGSTPSEQGSPAWPALDARLVGRTQAMGRPVRCCERVGNPDLNPDHIDMPGAAQPGQTATPKAPGWPVRGPPAEVAAAAGTPTGSAASASGADPVQRPTAEACARGRRRGAGSRGAPCPQAAETAARAGVGPSEAAADAEGVPGKPQRRRELSGASGAYSREAGACSAVRSTGSEAVHTTSPASNSGGGRGGSRGNVRDSSGSTAFWSTQEPGAPADASPSCDAAVDRMPEAQADAPALWHGRAETPSLRADAPSAVWAPEREMSPARGHLPPDPAQVPGKSPSPGIKRECNPLPPAGRRAAALHGALLAGGADLALACELDLLLHLLAAACAPAPGAGSPQPSLNPVATAGNASCAEHAPGATSSRGAAQRRLLPDAVAAGAYAASALQAAGEACDVACPRNSWRAHSCDG